jgi:hypothetical protein
MVLFTSHLLASGSSYDFFISADMVALSSFQNTWLDDRSAF